MDDTSIAHPVNGSHKGEGGEEEKAGKAIVQCNADTKLSQLGDRA